MGFIKGQYIPTANELINTAFQKARTEADRITDKDLASKIINKEKLRVKVSAEELTSKLKTIINQFPDLSELNPLYRALLKNTIDIIKLKKALGHLNASSRTIDELKNNTLIKMSRSRRETISKNRNEFYGRIVSVVKRCDSSLNVIKNAMKEFSQIPKIRDLPTILLIGLPNTGKSTFLQKITNANVEIKNYPFTTKRLQVGKISDKYLEFQILDSPGLLDRTEEKQNKIEKQTTIALRTIANSIIFIFDAKQSIKNQLNILKRYKKEIKEKPYFVILNKIDLVDEKELNDIRDELKTLKSKIYEKALKDISEEEIKLFKNEIYKMNKSWFIQKGNEKIK